MKFIFDRKIIVDRKMSDIDYLYMKSFLATNVQDRPSHMLLSYVI